MNSMRKIGSFALLALLALLALWLRTERSERTARHLPPALPSSQTSSPARSLEAVAGKPGEPAPSPAAPSQAPAALQLAALRAELEELRAQLGERRGDAPEQDVPTPPSDQLEAAERKQTEEVIARIDQRYRDEGEDPVWSGDAEGVLSQAFVADAVRGHSKIEELDCQATLCRLRSTHDSGQAALALISQLGRNALFGGSEAFSERFERTDGSVETLTYITRAGHSLPREQTVAAR